MNNNLTIFTSTAFGDIRVLTVEDEPWFVAVDVCRALEIKNSRDAIARLDEDEKAAVALTDTSSNGVSQAREFTTVNEPGLYTLVLGSRKPEAKQFKRWITHEVIPSIRKHGGYLAGAEALSEEELMAKALLVAQRVARDCEERNQRLTAENSRLLVDKTVMQPKADYFDELVERNTLTNFRETSKQLAVGPKKFVQWLLEHKYIYRDKKGKLLPYEEKNHGLFEVKECFNEKTQWSGTQTLVTPKGRETFRLLLQGV